MTATQVKFSGPFFQRDPGLTLRGNIEKAMAALADQGEQTAREAFRSTEGSRAPISAIGDKVSSHVIGRVRSLEGRKWRASAAISINNSGWSQAQGISLMAAAASVERRTHVMRNLARSLRLVAPLIRADLTAGIE